MEKLYYLIICLTYKMDTRKPSKDPIFICIIIAIITKRNKVSLLEHIFSFTRWLIHSFIQQTAIEYLSWSQPPMIHALGTNRSVLGVCAWW